MLQKFKHYMHQQFGAVSLSAVPSVQVHTSTFSELYPQREIPKELAARLARISKDTGGF